MHDTSNTTISILNIPFSPMTKKECLADIRQALLGERIHKIFTPNAEMLVDAYFDEQFASVLQQADISLCDSTAVHLASRGALHKLPGVNIMIDILSICEQEGKSVYFLGSGSSDTLAALKNNVMQQFPNLIIAGMHPGPKISLATSKQGTSLVIDSAEQAEVLADIAANKPEAIFVAFGHNKQEQWIHQYLSDLSTAKIAMGVGGSFDFLSGKYTRAPQFMQRMGLEWLYRLIQQPTRFKRIIKAVIGFPTLYLINKIT